MAITSVWIAEGFISLGMSDDICPEIFKVKESAKGEAPNFFLF